jgi:glutamyl-tRNA synthetase
VYLSPPVPAPPPHFALSRPETSRLAPSPTGALHLGNARTFLINWALARREAWQLILRIEDLDTPRVKPDAVAGIIDTLQWLGIEWDTPPGEELIQSRDLEPYRTAMRHLAAHALVYPCALSRTEIEAAASAPQEGAHEVRFPAHLRPALRGLDFDAIEAAAPEGTNWRFAVPDADIAVDDTFAGSRSFNIAAIVGDFVVWTKRRQPSYQLAVVVDDHRQGVTRIVRGDDLLDSAARQLLLYRALGYAPEPRHLHLPLVLGPDGKRLAKRHGDTRVDHYRALGVPAAAVVGLIARWCGAPLPPAERGEISAPEFLDVFDLTKMPAQSVTFTPEDDLWLRSRARRG